MCLWGANTWFVAAAATATVQSAGTLRLLDCAACKGQQQLSDTQSQQAQTEVAQQLAAAEKLAEERASDFQQQLAAATAELTASQAQAADLQQQLAAAEACKIGLEQQLAAAKVQLAAVHAPSGC
jgi:septal ring factor EnvC (AmiA/AmiB activator)